MNDSEVMHIVHVHIHVKPGFVDAFAKASRENAMQSLREPGVCRFDVLQQQDDPTRFILVEAYFTPEDALKHKETTHYKVWRDTVEEMMAVPRVSGKFNNLFPEDQRWDKV